jgi:hypothetical protein
MTPEASPSEKSSFLMTFAQHAWWALCLVWKSAKKLLKEPERSNEYSVSEIKTFKIEVPHGERLDPKLIEAILFIRQRQALRSVPVRAPTSRRSRSRRG